MEHINALAPDLLVTECLSCRLQFEQMSNYPVRHPLELLNRVPENR
jgi:glycerol-3-phosphate dehydrogenase subunit C